MGKKKILIVSRSFYPENSPRSFRATELAKEFARQGHEVTVLINFSGFSYDDFEKEYKLKILDQIQCKRYIHNLFSTKRSLLKRLKDRFLYQAFLYPEIQLSFAIQKELQQIKKNYDVLISIAKPYAVHIGVALAMRKIKKNIGIWIADCGDPFITSTLFYRFPFYFRWIEKWMFSKTDYVTIPVQSAKPAYPKSVHEKIHIIPQGFDFNDKDIHQGSVKNKVPTFAYAGALYHRTRSPEKLLQHLSSTDKDFRFILYTSNTDLLEPYLDQLKGKIEIREPIPRKILLYELSKMDFLLNIENITQEMVPSKIIDYYLTGRPVLSIHPESFDPNIIDQFLDENYSQQFVFDNFNKYDIQNFTQ